MGNHQIKRRMKAGETVIGTWNSFPSPSVVNAIGCAGLDFVVIDCEHGPMNFETAENLVRAAEASGMSSVIRVPSNTDHFILRALDIGADGVQVPHVSSSDDAVEVVKSAKYSPIGERGLSPFTKAGLYGVNAVNHIKDSNEKTMVVLNVEGVEGLKNLPSISSVDGVDVVFIGPYDLSQSMGKPGDVENPEVISAIKQAVTISKENNISCGSFARDEKYLDILISCGVQYITYSVDNAVITNAYSDLKTLFKSLKK